MPSISIGTITIYIHAWWYQVSTQTPNQDPNASSIDQIAESTGPGIRNQYVYVSGPLYLAGVYNNWLYLRFPLTAPQGASIVDTTLTFHYGAGGEALDRYWEIRGVDVDNALDPRTGTAYPPAAPAFCALDRTTARVYWQIFGAIPEVGTPITTPDIGSILTEVVARPGWESGNTIGLWIAPAGRTDLTQFYGADYMATVPAYNDLNFRQFSGVITPTNGTYGRFFSQATIIG